MDREQMLHEENYCFDTSGYLVVPGVLNDEQLSECREAVEAAGRHDRLFELPQSTRQSFCDLMIHPTLVWYLNQICGDGFRLDVQPEVFTNGGPTSEWTGGNEPRKPGLAYYYQNGRRFCEGVRALWALTDIDSGDGGFEFVPCSHTSFVETPQDLLDGTDDMGLPRQLSLKAGDLLLCAETLLYRVLPWTVDEARQLLSYRYVSFATVHAAGVGPKSKRFPRPDWHEELTPEQRTILQHPLYQDTTPPPAVESDGVECRIESDPDEIYPSIYIRNPDSDIDGKEFYFWDLCGYLVIRDVFSKEDLAAANEAADLFQKDVMPQEGLAGQSKTLAGTGRPVLPGLLQLPKPYCDPFRKMIAHPAIVQRLNWMGGKGFRCGDATLFTAEKGTSGHALHDGKSPLNPSRGYVYQNGRCYCEAITVAFQLYDVRAGDGGFCAVPGSHKSHYRKPIGVRTCDADMGLVVQPGMNAGDVLFFMDGGTTHGTLPWKSEFPRRSVLIKYESQNFNRSGGDYVNPETRWGSILDGMTEEQISIMRGPDRDSFTVNVPRLVVEDGQVSVSYERASGGLYGRETPDGPAEIRQKVLSDT